MQSPALIESLRAQIRRIENGHRPLSAVLPFGLAAIDACLPGGGLALGALHAVTGRSGNPQDGAVSALFAAGIAARTAGPVLWCVTRQDLFAPGLAQAGLAPERVLYVEAGDERTVLACCEDGLRHGGLAAVVAEVGRLPMTAARRLQLAAESGSTLAIVIRGIAVRPGGGPTVGGGAGSPTAAVTDWRVTALPSAALPVPGVGRARWRVELMRCRGGGSAVFTVEACDAEGHLAVPADLADRSAAADAGHGRAST